VFARTVFGRGDTFVGGSLVLNKHLHCVINTPGLHGGVALVVNLSTCVRESDAACILKPGDHEWIKHDSFVDYNFSKCVAVGDLA
jgi:hypothetical protein